MSKNLLIYLLSIAQADYDYSMVLKCTMNSFLNDIDFEKQ